MVDENGGTLVHTPNYNKDDNLQVRNIVAALDSNGLLQATVNTNYRGLQQDELHEILNGLSKDKLMEYLKQYIDLPSYDINKFDYKEDSNILPSIHETLDIISNNYAAVSGKRIFIDPNILNRSRSKLKDFDKRTCDILLRKEYKDIDSIEISVPQGYSAETVPADINLISKFGRYFSSTKVLPGKIIYFRINERVSGRYPASDAKELADYFDKISKADRSKVVLVKNE